MRDSEPVIVVGFVYVPESQEIVAACISVDGDGGQGREIAWTELSFELKEMVGEHGHLYWTLP